MTACAYCNGTGQIWLGSQGAYSIPDEAYAPCPMCNPRRNENADRCPVCGGKNPGDITHTRCAT